MDALRRMNYGEHYKRAHGLHVMDDVYVEDCIYCGMRAKIKALARMQGIDPEEACSDATIARNLVGRAFDREIFFEEKARVLDC
jgi:hypothetical protein